MGYFSLTYHLELFPFLSIHVLNHLLVYLLNVKLLECYYVAGIIQ